MAQQALKGELAILQSQIKKTPSSEKDVLFGLYFNAASISAKLHDPIAKNYAMLALQSDPSAGGSSKLAQQLKGISQGNYNVAEQ
jgi:hypothetical protein